MRGLSESGWGFWLLLLRCDSRLAVRAGENGRLFGAVTVGDIVEAIAAKGAQVDKRRVELSAPIKSVGAHTVTVRVHPQVSATVILDVVAAK